MNINENTRAAEPDDPAMPEGMEPAAVGGEPSDDELKDACLEQHRDCDMALYITKPPAPEIPEEIRLAFAELERKEQSLRDFRSLRESLAADRTCRPAAPPAPEVDLTPDYPDYIDEREVRELVAALHEASDGASAMGFEQDSWAIARAATLLEQLSTAALAVVPVAVSERLPGPSDCDAEGFCWFWSPEDQCWFWERIDSGFCRRYGAEFAWLPAHALPLPSGEVRN